MLLLIGADLVFWKKKKSTLPGLEPGTDGFQAYHRDHCSISIWMNVGRFPKVLYFPITYLPDGVLLKARPQNRFLLLENIIVNQKYQHDRIPRLAYEGGSESSVIGVITLLIYMIGCCIIP